jgi:transketolase
MLRTAIEAVDQYLPEASVWSVPSIKPIDVGQVATICRNSKGVIVLEEHSILGGLGSAVAEIATEHAPVRILRVGVPDRFSKCCGSYDYLLREHGLDAKSIRSKIGAFVETL